MAVQVKFVASMFNINILQNLGRGDQITDKIWITNDATILSEKILTPGLIKSMGQLEVGALRRNRVFLYGNYEADIDVNDEVEQMTVLNKHLFDMQSFASCLWLAKDNCINLELAFLEVNDLKGKVKFHSNMWDHVVSTSRGEVKMIADFSRDELRSLRKLFRNTNVLPTNDDIVAEMISFQPYAGQLNAISRAAFFIKAARVSAFIPVKIANYCSSLECLFLRESQELSFRLPLRIAFFLESEPSERFKVYSTMREAYDVRSKTVHGSAIKPKLEQLKLLSQGVDEITRQVHHKIMGSEELLRIFNSDNAQEFNNYMNGLVFGVPMDVYSSAIESD